MPKDASWYGSLWGLGVGACGRAMLASMTVFEMAICPNIELYRLGGGSVFFSVKTKSARESHFCPFFRFSSRVEKLFHGHFFRFFPVFFTGTQIGFTGRIYQKSYHFRGENCSKFFTGTDFFHGWNFDENLHGHDFPFTGTFWAKTSFFSREDFFFHGEKKNPARHHPHVTSSFGPKNP